MDVVEKLAQAKGNQDLGEVFVMNNKSHFREAEKVEKSIIDMCSNVRNMTERSLRIECDNVIDVLMEYQEQPGLLDPHLRDLVTPIMRMLSQEVHATRNDVGPGAFPDCNNIYLVCRIIYVLTIVRGFKVVMKHFPHEAADCEPVLLALERGGEFDNSATNWHVRHLLLLWMAHLMLVPFTFDALDSARAATAHLPESERPPTMRSRVVSLGQSFLSSASRVREAAAVMLGKVFGRADAHVGGAVEEFMEWCAVAVHGAELEGGQGLLAEIANDTEDANQSVRADGEFVHKVANQILTGADIKARQLAAQQASLAVTSDSQMRATGALHAIHEVLKRATRQASRPLLPAVYDRIVSRPPVLAASCAIARKLRMKCVGRLALALLSPRLAKWRYSRGARSLALTQLAAASEKPVEIINKAKGKEETETDEDVKEDEICSEVEEILDILLLGLRDSDANVRWSAAKGIGRISGRLPRKFAEDVARACLECFEEREPDRSWHGGALAIAELMRRGLLLDDVLKESVDAIVRGLHFKASASTAHSASARDAACYACWSLARAFSLDQVKDVLPPLTDALIQLAVFDREVNCRRAAAAALQEIVGRLGGVVNGISIVRTLDFFALAAVSNCYSKVAIELATLGHAKGLVDFLMHHMVRHATPLIRHNAAKCLGRLARLGTSLAALDGPAQAEGLALLAHLASAMPVLSEQTTDLNVEVRHGSLHALANLTRSMPSAQVPAEVQDSIRSVVVRVEKARLYTGKGGESVREGVCALASALAESDWSFKAATANRLLKSVLESATHLSAAIQLCARDAMSRLAHHRLEADACNDLANQLLTGLKAKTGVNVAARRGFANALGAVPVGKIQPATLKAVVEALALEAADKLHPGKAGAELRDAETRVNSLLSLAILVDGLKAAAVTDGAAFNAPYEHVRQQAVTATVAALGDKQADRRGDVGSWVRETALEVAALLLESHQGGVELLAGLVTQAGDKINRTRARAVFLLHRLYVGSPAAKSADGLPGAERTPLRAGFIFRRVHFKVAYGTDQTFGRAFAGGDEIADDQLQVEHQDQPLMTGANDNEETANANPSPVSVADVIDGASVLDRVNLDPALLAAAPLNDLPLNRSSLPLAAAVSKLLNSSLILSVPRTADLSAYGAAETNLENGEDGTTRACDLSDATLESFSGHPVPWAAVEVFAQISNLLIKDEKVLSAALPTWAVTAGGPGDLVSRGALTALMKLLRSAEGVEKKEEVSLVLLRALSNLTPASLMQKSAEVTLTPVSLPVAADDVPQSTEAISRAPVAMLLITAASLAAEGLLAASVEGEILFSAATHTLASMDVVRLKAAATLFVTLASAATTPGVGVTALALALVLIQHPYPSVRLHAATLAAKLALNTTDEALPAVLAPFADEEVTALWTDLKAVLLSVQWDSEVAEDIPSWLVPRGVPVLSKVVDSIIGEAKATLRFGAETGREFSLPGALRAGGLVDVTGEWRDEKVRQLEARKAAKNQQGFGYSDLLRAEHTGMY